MKPFEKYVKVEEERYLKLLENEERINKAKEFIEKNIELNNNILPNVEGQLHDLIKNENDVLNCLKKILIGE